jgi:hypothetical protein
MTLFLRPSRTELSPSRIKTKCRRAFSPVTAGPIASPLMCFHKDQIVHIGTDAMLQACVFSGRIVAFRSHQAGFTFGQIGTDATLQACAYSGQIGASTPHRADFTFGRIVTDATLQACAYSGQIGASMPHQADFTFGHDDSDGLGSRALNAVHAHAVTYPAEGHLGDYAPSRG